MDNRPESPLRLDQLDLLNPVSNVFPKAEHRNCARHVYANWKKSYKGDDLKKKFWRAVRAYTRAGFESAIEEMGKISPDGKTAFLTQNPSIFCRAFLNPTTKCDVVVSNMAETFNGYIIQARSLHLIDMMESIRLSLMERLYTKQTAMEKHQQSVCPRVQLKLEAAKEEAVNCTVAVSDIHLFQVGHGLNTLVVDMVNEKCTCKVWDLTGIPCCHAIAVAFFLRKKAEDFVSSFLKKDTYLKAYAGRIAPMTRPTHWPTVDDPYDPPDIKIGPGHPKKNRRKDPFEDPKKPGQLTKHGFEMSCSVCKEKGHNKRTCPSKDKVVPTDPPPKRPRGRPRKDASEQSCVPSQQSQVTQRTQALQDMVAEPQRKSRGRGKGSSKRGALLHEVGKGGAEFAISVFSTML